MHTSKILEAGHFEYRRPGTDTGESSTAGFDALCPDYHPQDRLGIVSVPFEAGLRHTGLAVLAWTTAFYDALRAERSTGFFDYPQHYVFYAATAPETSADEAVGNWGHLDVWPDCKRVAAPTSVSGLVQQLFEYEINRLLWPHHLSAAGDEARLPNYILRMLRTRLKGVYVYGGDSSTIEIRGREPALKLTRKTREQAGVGGDPPGPSVEAYQQLDGDHFLDTYLASVFEPA